MNSRLKRVKLKQTGFMLFKLIRDLRVLLGCLLSLSAVTSTIAVETHTFDAKAAGLIGGAVELADSAASNGHLVSLTASGRAVEFKGLPAAGKLAIRYASTNVGTISVVVDNQPARKVNIHSSGALTNSFLNAIIDLAIPAKARLTTGFSSSSCAYGTCCRRGSSSASCRSGWRRV